MENKTCQSMKIHVRKEVREERKREREEAEIKTVTGWQEGGEMESKGRMEERGREREKSRRSHGVK